MKKVKVAILGTGGISPSHVAGWKASPDAELVAAIDIDGERARERGAQWNVLAATSLEDALEQRDIDLVDVCTQEHLHADTSIDALGRTGAVLTEKIMASSLDDGLRMVEVMEKRQSAGLATFAAVQYNYHYFPAFKALHELIREHRFGKVNSAWIISHRFCFHHVLEAVRWLLGPPETVRAENTARDWDSDTGASFRISNELMYIPPDGSRCTLSYPGGGGVEIISSGLVKLSSMPFQITVLFESGDSYTATAQDWESDMRGRQFIGAEPLDRQDYLPDTDQSRGIDSTLSFVGSIRGIARRAARGMAPEVSWKEGFTTMLLDHAILEAGKSGKEIGMSALFREYGISPNGFSEAEG